MPEEGRWAGVDGHSTTPCPTTGPLPKRTDEGVLQVHQRNDLVSAGLPFGGLAAGYPRVVSKNPHHNALDVLEHEDRQVLETLGAIDVTRGSGTHLHESVEDRALYGDLVKRLIREAGTREAAQADVVSGLGEEPGLSDVATAMETHAKERRPHLDAGERMSRGVPGMVLNTGQDFDPELRALAEVMREEIRWELDDAIPAIRRSLSREAHDERFSSGRWVRRHAPTNLDPGGPLWHERARIVSFFRTIFDRARDYPTAAKRAE